MRGLWALLVLVAASAPAVATAPAPVLLTICPTLLDLAPGGSANLSAEIHNMGAAAQRVAPFATMRAAGDEVGLVGVWKLRATRAALDVAPNEYAALQWRVAAPAVSANPAPEIDAVLAIENMTLAPGEAPLVARLRLAGAPENGTSCARARFVPAGFAAAPIAPAGALVLASLAGGAAIVGSAGGALRARARGQAWWGLGPFLPLFTRLTSSRLLDQDTRSRIYEAIQARPGIRFAQLKRELSLSTGVVDHHTRLLVRAALVVTRREGRHRVFYAQRGEPAPAEAPLGDTSARLLARVREHGPSSYADLMADLALSKASISHHVRLLEARGLVTLARHEDGRWLVQANA